MNYPFILSSLFLFRLFPISLIRPFLSSSFTSVFLFLYFLPFFILSLIFLAVSVNAFFLFFYFMFPFVSLIISLSYISVFSFITFVSPPFFHLPFHELKIFLAKRMCSEITMKRAYERAPDG